MSSLTTQTKEAMHRMGENAQESINDLKRATVGGSKTGDKVSEGSTKMRFVQMNQYRSMPS